MTDPRPEAIRRLTAAGVDNPRLDARLLWDHAQHSSGAFESYVKRRVGREPVAYITGHKEFWSLDFEVGPGVLIPRPETEQIVEQALLFLKEIPEEDRQILDLGTGSGCIAISLAKSIPCNIWAVDSSKKALEVARNNAINLGVNTAIQWRHGDWFAGLYPQDPDSFRLIVSNPPYIALSEKEELDPEVRDYEPAEALFAGDIGLEAYETIERSFMNRLVIGGAMILEINGNNYDKVTELFQRNKLKESLYHDLQGLPRVLKLVNS